jgi:hypothetical protein
MSRAAATSEGQEIPADVEAILRRRKGPERLYWRLRRPRAYVYAREAVRVLLYRVAAAAAAIVAITLCAFLGMVAGNIGTPRWPQLAQIGKRTVTGATVHAVTQFAAWMPAFTALGVILVIIPRPRRWVFGLTVLAGGALGYYQRHLPPFPRSAIASAITGRSASMAAHLPLQLSVRSAPVSSAPVSATAVASAVLIGAVMVGYGAYRYSYDLARRSTGHIPRRPLTHYRSTFTAVSLPRRLAAVPIAAAMLAVGVWIAESLRAPLPGVHYWAFFFGYSPPSITVCVLAALIVAWVICMPAPQGFPWLLILPIFGMTVYAFAPHVYLIPLPAIIPAASPGSFWALVVTYLCVTGFGYNLVAVLLDWR